MRLLLDTHIFLWYIAADKRLGDRIRDAISDPKNDVYLSVISLWESIVKHKLGKLPLPESPETYLPEQRDRHMVSSLELDEASVAKLARLPPFSSRSVRPHDRLPGDPTRFDDRYC